MKWCWWSVFGQHRSTVLVFNVVQCCQVHHIGMPSLCSVPLTPRSSGTFSDSGVSSLKTLLQTVMIIRMCRVAAAAAASSTVRWMQSLFYWCTVQCSKCSCVTRYVGQWNGAPVQTQEWAGRRPLSNLFLCWLWETTECLLALWACVGFVVSVSTLRSKLRLQPAAMKPREAPAQHTLAVSARLTTLRYTGQ